MITAGIPLEEANRNKDTCEEVNLIVRGGNYQWAYLEGTIAGLTKTRPNTIFGTDQPPVYDYPHADANACVIGGYVYRGLQHAADLSGKYTFGDNFCARIWALTYNPAGGSTVEFLCSMPPGKNYLAFLRLVWTRTTSFTCAKW